MDNLTIEQLREMQCILQKRNQELEEKLFSTSFDDDKAKLRVALTLLKFTEDTDEFTLWETNLKTCTLWKESPSSTRILRMLQYSTPALEIRLRIVRPKLALLRTSLEMLEKKDPNSRLLDWDNVRPKIIEIFMDQTPERKWRPYKVGEYFDLNMWSLVMYAELTLKTVSWAQFVAEINRAPPHPKLGRMFDPNVPELDRFKDICYSIYLKEQEKPKSKGPYSPKQAASKPPQARNCSYCHKKGHKESLCYYKKNKDCNSFDPKTSPKHQEKPRAYEFPYSEKIKLRTKATTDVTTTTGKPIRELCEKSPEFNSLNWGLYRQLMHNQSPGKFKHHQLEDLNGLDDEKDSPSYCIDVNTKVRGDSIER
ncbi:hypothetical protein NEHOM01_1675 [Nematocida homosporus]|uniref:uncharacterized protein n=1 Tax=Nematocida homosporus TaxID=1912981 RepID=UPI00222068DB|nr:uncharacterized protein NEHOM01_1675 [Nematocida homosporus]KAI5186744.1 hypothetical protein NEHOM01_1675 [Nematocida homosporus]